MKVGELIFAMRNSANIIAAKAASDFEIDVEQLAEEWLTYLARQWAKTLTPAELHARFELLHHVVCRVWQREASAKFGGVREDLNS